MRLMRLYAWRLSREKDGQGGCVEKEYKSAVNEGYNDVPV